MTRLAEVDTWPYLTLSVRPFPWTWRMRPRLYWDDVHPASFCSVEWLFLKLEWSAQDTVGEWFFYAKKEEE